MYESDELEIIHDKEKPSLATYFRVQKGHIIDADTLQQWRTRYLDRDDVFDPAFLHEIIFGGVGPSDISITRDAERLFETWQTSKFSYEPQVDAENGPYYIDKGRFFSVWKVFEDHKLAFVQSTWPANRNDR